MKFISSQLQAAGYGNYKPWLFIAAAVSVAVIVGSWAQLSFSILGLSLSASIAVIGLSFEILSIRAKGRSEAISKLWPEVIESLQSAAKSGIGLIDSISELGESGPWQIRKPFTGFIQNVDSGKSLDSSLTALKAELGQLHADRLIELIRIVHRSGVTVTLNHFSNRRKSRDQISQRGENLNPSKAG